MKHRVTFIAAVTALTAALLIGGHLSARTEDLPYSSLNGAENSGHRPPAMLIPQIAPGRESPDWSVIGLDHPDDAGETEGPAPNSSPSPDSPNIDPSEGSLDRNPGGDSTNGMQGPEAPAEGKRQEVKEVATAGERANYQEIFGNDLFIGDSITEGISFYGFVKENNVYSRLGLTLSKACEDLDEIKGSTPHMVYLMFGANDLEINGNDEYYLNNYRNLIAKLRHKWPHAEICIQSVLPLKDGVESRYQNLSNRRIRTINAKLADLAAESGPQVHFLDLTPVHARFTPDIYEKDGIHFKKTFYPAWLDYLAEHMK